MAGSEKQRIIVVCGPTATGKTALALALARRYGGELVCADSMQVYAGLAVGTDAPTPEMLGAVPGHLFGILQPQQSFSVAAWQSAAAAAIRDIHSRGALPVVCGGTGLYLQSLINGVKFTQESRSPLIREQLERLWASEGGAAMLQNLAVYDPARAAVLHAADKKRILRAIEAFLATGLTAASREAASRLGQPPYTSLCIALNYPGREALYAAINARVNSMLARGLLLEARDVWQNRASFKTAAQAIAYKEFFPYFEGLDTMDACTENLKRATRRYAKRQLTWFGKMPDISWVMAGYAGCLPAGLAEACRLTGAFLS